MMIEKRDITGLSAFNYIRKQLDIGRTLSNYINTFPIESGRVYALVPSGTSDEKLYKFDRGGIHPFDKDVFNNKRIMPLRNDSISLMLNEIQNYLSNNETNCCLFEDPVARPSDRWVERSDIDYVSLDNIEMFYFFNGKNNVIDNIKTAILRSDNYIFFCALSKLKINIHDRFANRNEINSELLQLFLEDLSMFFVKAYDGEAYLMWVNSSETGNRISELYN